MDAFTFAAYELLCQAIQASQLQPLTVAEYLAAKPARNFIILRYDVDARPEHALQMAKLLHHYNLCGTFYWRIGSSDLFDVHVMRQVNALGHEIGYHYETLSQAKGNVEHAALNFRRGLARFQAAGFAVDTAAAHGVPGYNNQLLFQRMPELLAECGLVGEAYASIDFSLVQYLSDAGWAWHRFPLRTDAQDFRRRHGAFALPQISHRALVDLVLHSDSALYLTTHPELWFSSRSTALIMRLRRKFGRRLLQYKVVKRLYHGSEQA